MPEVDPAAALQFLAAAARRVLVLEQANDFNAAVAALDKLVKNDAAQRAIAADVAKKSEA